MSYQITFNDIQKTIPVPNGMTILEASEQAGVEIPYSCRRGDCGTCTIRRIEGEVAHSHKDSSKGFPSETVLACVARPKSDLVCHTTYEEEDVRAKVLRVIEQTPTVKSYQLAPEDDTGFDFLPDSSSPWASKWMAKFITAVIPSPPLVSRKTISRSPSSESQGAGSATICSKLSKPAISSRSNGPGVVSHSIWNPPRTCCSSVRAWASHH